MRKLKELKGGRGHELKGMMSPMIDVVFLLLVFFIFAAKVEDLHASLEVSRPRTDRHITPPSVETLRIDVTEAGLVFNGRPVTFASMDRYLEKLASFSVNQQIVLTSTPNAPHGGLVRVLDLCAKHQLKAISIFSR